MPDRLLYDEAMLFSSVRLKIPDPDIKEGKVEMIKVQSRAGTLERPWGVEGGFAVVYKFRTASRRFRALRCFRVPMNADMQFRYERMGSYFQRHLPSLTAGFKYHNEGILIKEQAPAQNKLYPVIEMDWIEGMTLLEKVDECCQQNDQQQLQHLSEQWLGVLKQLQKAKIAHGDLAGLNVMVGDDARLILIDYDSIYIPDFSGMQQTILGQADYQHPQVERRVFNEHMDAFSAMVIYLTLIALAVRPDLWNKYMARENGKLLDTNLLFERKDFLPPYQSPLLSELEQIDDQLVQSFTRELKRACRQPVEMVRFPFQLVDPDYPKELRLGIVDDAIATDDDDLIINSWAAPLLQYPPAQRVLERVRLAQTRSAALTKFRNANKSAPVVNIIVANYDPDVLGYSPKMTSKERAQVSLSHDFVRAYARGEDNRLLDIYDKLRHWGVALAPDQQRHVDTLQKDRQEQQDIRGRLQSGKIARIAASRPAPRIYRKLTGDEQRLLALAQDFDRAYRSDRDEAIVAAYEALQEFARHAQLTFVYPDEERIALARQRQEALMRFHKALDKKLARGIVEAYDPILEQLITPEQRKLLALAKQIVDTVRINPSRIKDDAAIVELAPVIQQAVRDSLLLLEKEEKERIQLAEQRKPALEYFQAALQTKGPRQIVEAYKRYATILPGNIDRDDEAKVRLANRFVYAHDDEEFLAAYKAIHRHGYGEAFIFSLDERTRAQRLQEKETMLQNFEHALAHKKAKDIVEAHKTLGTEARKYISPEQEDIVKHAKEFLFIYDHNLKTAIARNDVYYISNHYNNMLKVQRLAKMAFTDITSEDMKIIGKALKADELKQALDEHDYQAAIIIARELSGAQVYRVESDTHRKTSVLSAHNTTRLNEAVKEFLKTKMLTKVLAEIGRNQEGPCLKLVWQWPEDDLIQEAVIQWDSTRLTPLPQLQRRLKREQIHPRKNNEEYGHKEIKIGTAKKVYVYVYAAICAEWDEAGHDDENAWCLSPGTACNVGTESGDEAARPQEFLRNREAYKFYGNS